MRQGARHSPWTGGERGRRRAARSCVQGKRKKQRFFRNTESLQAEPAFNKRCSRRRECSRSCWRAASLSSSSYRPTYTTRTPAQPSLCCGMQAKVPVNWAQASHLWSELQLVSWLGRAAARGEPRRRALAPARFGCVAAAGAGLRETAGLRLSCKRHRAEDIPLRAWKGHLADGRLTLRCRDTNSTPAAEDQNTRTKPRRDGAGAGQVIPTPLHVLGRISPISPPFFPVFCAFLPSRRGGF